MGTDRYKKKRIAIGERLSSDIVAYCDMNSMDPQEYAERLLKEAFTADVYGRVPFGKPEEERPERKEPAEIPQPAEPEPEPVRAETPGIRVEVPKTRKRKL